MSNAKVGKAQGIVRSHGYLGLRVDHVVMDPGVPPQCGSWKQIVKAPTGVLDAAVDRSPSPAGRSNHRERQLSAEHRLRERVGQRAINDILLLGDVAGG